MTLTELHSKDAFRVSDRSGTPQAGNPAEEYSGERDPRLLRGARPTPSNHLTFSTKQHL